MKKDILNIVVPLKFDGHRIDKFLQDQISKFSRTRLQRLIHDGEIKLKSHLTRLSKIYLMSEVYGQVN